MVSVGRLETDSLSTLRTRHRFLRYGEFHAVEEFLAYRRWAAEHGLALYILGNGSNTFFASKTVRTLVLRNRLPRRLLPLDGERVEVSSSLPVGALLRYCRRRHLDSFFYLASAPATVGGAIAMNAGRGRDYAMTVFDFLERVSYVEGDNAVHVAADEIERGHRWTRFTGIHGRLIVSAVFRFRPGAYEGDPVADRLAYARKHQDLTAPSCGSVFADCSATVQTKLRGLRIGTACYSAKATNWILNLGDDPRPVCALIAVSRALHALVGKRAILEIVAVE